MKICIYGAASPLIDAKYIERVEELGRRLAERGHSLVFGGGGNGLMGAAARGVKETGGKILGVVPKFFLEEGVEAICDFCDTLITPDTMRERKQIMEDNADGFIVVPGGIGTFEEYFEILTASQLRLHNKPIGVFNIDGYYDDLCRFLDKTVEERFVNKNTLDLHKVSDDIEVLLDYIEGPHKEYASVKELKDG